MYLAPQGNGFQKVAAFTGYRECSVRTDRYRACSAAACEGVSAHWFDILQGLAMLCSLRVHSGD